MTDGQQPEQCIYKSAEGHVLRLLTDLFVEGIESQLCCVVGAAKGGDITAHHAGVGLAIILTIPLPVLLHHL